MPSKNPQNQKGLLVEVFVRRQEIIRIFIDGNGGNGDQTASINIMRYLRFLGFKGLFEVIYPGSSENRETLYRLFDFQRGIPDEYFDAKNNIYLKQIMLAHLYLLISEQ